MDNPNRFSAEEHFRQAQSTTRQMPRPGNNAFSEAAPASSIVGALVRAWPTFFVILMLLSFGGADARPQAQDLTPSGPIELVGKNGAVISGVRVTSTTGNCVTIENSSNVVIEKSEIGPCGDPNADDMGNGIVISGSQNVQVSDSYIHVDNRALACCDKRDNLLVEGSSNVVIQGNVIAYGETNVEINEMPSDHISVIGNFLLNPRGPFPRGQNIQSWGSPQYGPNTKIAISENYALSSPSDKQFAYAEKQEDSISFGYTSDSSATGNYVVGGRSPTGCGLIADRQANEIEFLDNILSDTGQCGVGIASGVRHTVVGNKILNEKPVPGAGNTALYVWNQYKDAGCGRIIIAQNTADELKIDGATHSGYWNGGGCDSVILKDNIWNAAAYERLHPLLQTNPPPPIPVRPKSCTTVSPYTTNASLPSCGASSQPPSDGAPP
jgi:uncharacterized Zn-binding protein involved in type VI secretion